MTKRTEIFHKLKANLWVLLLVCFALFLCSGLAEAADTPCNKERMDKIYKSGCYACDIVTALIGSFVTACQYLYDVSKDAGTKILFIGVMLWLAFYILQQLVSLKNLEPAAMVNELLIMAFKILGAYLVIIAGIDFFINFALVPFMNFGADFGLAMVNAAYAPLDGYVPVEGAQMDDVLDQFATIINPRYFSLLTDKNDDVVAMGAVIPSICDVLIRSRGHMTLPAIIGLLRTIARPKELEMVLVAVRPDYQKKGVNSVMMARIIRNIIEDGVQKIESNPELVSNLDVQAQWTVLQREIVKRRKCFIKEIR